MKHGDKSGNKNREEVTEILVILNPYDLDAIWIWGKEGKLQSERPRTLKLDDLKRVLCSFWGGVEQKGVWIRSETQFVM